LAIRIAYLPLHLLISLPVLTALIAKAYKLQKSVATPGSGAREHKTKWNFCRI